MARATARTAVAGRNGGLKSAAAASRLGRHAGQNVDVQLTCETRRLWHAGEERNTKDLCVCSTILREGERKRGEGGKNRRNRGKVFAIAKADEKSALDVMFPYFEGTNK